MDLPGRKQVSLDLSLGEFSALTAKAFRGAGYPWGVATDGAYAARVLAQHQLPAAEIVARLLICVQDHGVSALAVDAPSKPDRSVCPVSLGAAISDLGDAALSHAPSLLGSRTVLEPMLLAPYLSNCVMVWVDGQISFDRTGMHVSGDIPTGQTSIELRALASAPITGSAGRPPVATRATVDAASHETLLVLAGRTYAPATDESRNAGAGEST